MATVDAAQHVERLVQELDIQDKTTKVTNNVWTLHTHNVMLQLVAAPEFIVVTARILDHLPTKNGEEFYRMLLSANTQLLGAFFTLETNQTIRINQVIPIAWANAPELAFIIGNIATKAEEWEQKLESVVDSPV